MKNEYKIIRMHENPGGLDQAIAFYHSKWGRENNYAFIEDAIKNSNYNNLPQFFVLLKNEAIVACCGLMVNDLVSRQDLYPGICGLYVEKSERRHGLGSELLAVTEETAKEAGFTTLYLTTDHTSYYERYAWTFLEIAYEPDGSPTRIYMKKIGVK